MKHEEFYGALVPAEAIEAEDQGLAQYQNDLVAAHLSRNYAYFGAIDKTLSGFMILNDEGDDYLLFDLRDPKGPIYFQDHEERECFPKFDSLKVYKKFLAECAKRQKRDDDFYSGDLYEEKYRPKKKASKKGGPKKKVGAAAPSSAELLQRYQWMVWFFAQPMKTTTDQSPQHYGGYAVGTFEHHFKNAARLERLFEAELPLVASDPHLAIYWLLHATVRCEEERRTRVLEAAAALSVPLWQAFRATFGELPLDGELLVLPSFRARRADISLRWAIRSDAPVTRLLQTLAIDHHEESLLKALWLKKVATEKSFPEIEEGLKKLRGASPGVRFLRALLDLRAGKKKSRFLSPLSKSFGKRGVSSEHLLLALHKLLPLVEADPSVHARVCEGALSMLNDKPFSSICLELLAVTSPSPAEKRGYEKRAKAVESIQETIAALQSKDESELANARRARGRLSKTVQLLLARKIASDPSHFQPDDQQWALQTVSGSKFPERVTELTAALAKSNRWVREPFIKKMAPKSARDSNTEVLLRILELPELDSQENFSTKMNIDNLKEIACHALSGVATKPAVFERLMKVMDTPELIIGRHQISEELIDTKGDYTKFAIQHLLSNEQAAEAAKRMIAQKLSGEPEHSLYYLRHKGAESVLIEALRTVTHEGTVGALYSAVRNMGTPRAREAILERLFVDEPSIWRLLDAIKDIWSAKVRKTALRMMKEREDHAAINRYMWGLVDFVGQREPAIELLEFSLSLPVKSAENRAFKKFVLIEGAKLALERSDLALAGRAWREAEQISEPPRSIYHEVRKQTWKDPFEDAKLRAQVEAALQSLSDTSAAGDGAQAKARPAKSKKQSAPGLAKLAKSPLYAIVLRDGHRALFLDDEKKLHYYDGFELGAPPFEAISGHPMVLRPMLKRVKRVDERVMFWKGGSAFVEWMRAGRFVFSWADLNSGGFRNVATPYGMCWACGFAFKDESSAIAMMDAARKDRPAGMKETDPFYLEKKGAILRTYYDKNGKRESGARVGPQTTYDRQVHANEAAAAAAYAEWEAKRFRAGSSIGCIEWSKGIRKTEDMSFSEFWQQRRRNDSESAVWHMGFFPELRSYLRRTKLDKKVTGLSIKVGRGASPTDIDKVETELKCKVPDALREVWLEYGAISWTVGDRGLRLLSPKQLLSRRARQQAWNEDAIANKMSPAERKRLTKTFRRLEVLVEDLEGNPTTLWCAQKSKKGDVFTHVNWKKPTENLWWARLGWTLCTEFSRDLMEALEAELGKAEMKKAYKPKGL